MKNTKQSLLLLFIAMVMAPWGMVAQTTTPVVSPNDKGEDVWYYISSVRAEKKIAGANVYTDWGATGSNKTLYENIAVDKHDGQLWKLQNTGKEGQFILINKLGRTIRYSSAGIEQDGIASDRFYTTEYSETDTYYFELRGSTAPNCQRIYSSEANNTIDKSNSDFGFDKWGADDEGTQVKFYLPEELPTLLPVKLTAEGTNDANAHWYIIKMIRNGGKCFTSAGVNEIVALTELTGEDKQLFKFVGDEYNTVKIVSKENGGKLQKVDSKIQLKEEGDLFKFRYATASKQWELQFAAGGASIDEQGASIGTWGPATDGNALAFTTLNEAFNGRPELSTADAPKWYFIQVARQGAVVKYVGEKENVSQTAYNHFANNKDDISFRFEGSYGAGFRIISKAGGECKQHPDEGLIMTTSEENGDLFKFVPYNIFGEDLWTLQNTAVEGGNIANDFGGTGDKLGFYSTDDGSAMRFIAEDYDPALPTIDAQGNTSIMAQTIPYLPEDYLINAKQVTITGNTAAGFFPALAKALKNNRNITLINIKNLLYTPYNPYRTNYLSAINPNCLFVVETTSNIGTFAYVMKKNVMKNSATASGMAISDNYPFDFPTQITLTAGATYTRQAHQDGGWETLILPFEANKPIGYDFEEFNEATNEYIRFTEVTSSTLEANKAYIMKASTTAEGTAPCIFTSAQEAANWNTTPAEGQFKGTYTDLRQTDVATHILILNSDGDAFGPAAADASIPAFRAYLDTEINQTEPQPAKLNVIHGNDDPTGIATAQTVESVYVQDGKIYVNRQKAGIIKINTLDGRVINKLQSEKGTCVIENLPKGIYIVNNQKVALF